MGSGSDRAMQDPSTAVATRDCVGVWKEDLHDAGDFTFKVEAVLGIQDE